jgi:glycosyltransferase involved in cell wall biosynthesis
LPGPYSETAPAICIVIPTYNRHELLRRTLESLAAQRMDLTAFEVVVSDDGSADATAEVARSFAGRLRLRYVFQPDEGVRIATARNYGARLATAPVLLFLDTGVLAGPDLVAAHLHVHREYQREAPRIAVIGYTHGFNPLCSFPELATMLAAHTLTEARERLADDKRFRDWRHQEFERYGFDLRRMYAPWTLFWTMNVSVRTADFRAIGGFDDQFRGWGSEDVDLGRRLAASGVRLVASREAWAIESPHERDHQANMDSNFDNAGRMFEKEPGILTEMYAAIYSRESKVQLDDEYEWQSKLEYEYRALLEWSKKARCDEPAPSWGLAAHDLRGKRVLVIGCGTTSPPRGAAAWTLLDYDEELLRQRLPSTSCTVVHGLGARIAFPDRSFDAAVVTSRLTGLWARWGSEILSEARRLAPEVRVLVRAGAQPAAGSAPS